MAYPYGRVLYPGGVYRPIVHSPLVVPGYGLGVPVMGIPHHQPPVLVGHPGYVHPVVQPVVLGQPQIVAQQPIYQQPIMGQATQQQQANPQQYQPYPPPVAADAKPPAADSVWTGPLLNPDHTPSHLLLILVHAVYDHLDRGVHPASQGGLSPEKIGIMAELCGVADEENIYKAMRATGQQMGQGDAYIDKQFTTYYASFRFLYTLAARATPTVSQSVMNGTTFTTTQQSNIPLLTRDGLVAFFVNNIMEDPARQHAWFTSFLNYIQLYHPGTGELLPRSIPRLAFPAQPHQPTVQKNQAIRVGLQRQHQLEYGWNGVRAPTPNAQH